MGEFSKNKSISQIKSGYGAGHHQKVVTGGKLQNSVLILKK